MGILALLGILGAVLGGTKLGIDQVNKNRAEEEQKKREADEAAAEDMKNKLYADLNNEFFTNIGNWSSDDLARWVADHRDWANDNNSIVNNYMDQKTRREGYSKDLSAQIEAYRQNGVNPMLVYGNIGNGASSSFNLGESEDTSYQEALLALKAQALAEQQNQNDNNFFLKLLSIAIVGSKLFK